MSEEMLHCPYNFSHVILKSRMAIHLIKCRQQHLEKLEACPFNSTHHVPKPEMEYHCKTCPDRRNLESHLFIVGDGPPSEDHILKDSELPKVTENWDEEGASCGSYLDVKHEVLENQVFRIPVGMSKSERKAFFIQEVGRFQSLSGDKKQTVSGGAGFSSSGQSSRDYREQLSSSASTSGTGSGLNIPEKDAVIVMRGKGRGRQASFD